MDISITAHDHFVRNIRPYRNPAQNHPPCHTVRGSSQSTIATYAWLGYFFWMGDATIISFCCVQNIQNTVGLT